MILSFGVFQLAYFSALMALGSDIARKDLGGASAWAAIITGELVGRIIGGVIAFKVHFTVHLSLQIYFVSLPQFNCLVLTGSVRWLSIRLVMHLWGYFPPSLAKEGLWVIRWLFYLLPFFFPRRFQQ